MELDKAIEKRHSVRTFKQKKPDWRKIIEVIDAAIKGPLAGNAGTLKFLLVDKSEKIKRLAKASQQSFIQNSKYLVIVCSDPAQLERSYDDRAKKYLRQQAGAAIQNFLLKLTDLELATCWVGAFQDEEVKRILNIPKDIEVEALFPIGYELGKGKQPTKPDLDNNLFFNKWKQKKMSPEKMPRD